VLTDLWMDAYSTQMKLWNTFTASPSATPEILEQMNFEPLPNHLKDKPHPKRQCISRPKVIRPPAYSAATACASDIIPDSMVASSGLQDPQFVPAQVAFPIAATVSAPRAIALWMAPALTP